MVIKKGIIRALAVGALLSSCQKDLIEYQNGDIKIMIEAGDEWKHPFEMFLGIKKQNPPQIAIWLEDMDGNYLTTFYVSYRGGTKSWSGSGGNPRKEALPYWNHARLPFQTGEPIPDGYTGATTQKPVPDAVTGATPNGSFDLKMKPNEGFNQFVIKAEFNHSTDYNEYYPKSAVFGDENYSAESGQPAVIYEAVIDLTAGQKEYSMQMIGHSSPDGSDGKLHTDLSKLTSAKNIVKEITIKIQE